MSLVLQNSIKENTDLLPSVLRLRGHKAPILSTRFNNDSSLLASGGLDRHLAIWNISSLDSFANREFLDETEIDFNYLQLHNSAITSLAWSNLQDNLIFTASADSTASCFDLNKSEKIKTFHHNSCVNQLDLSKRDMIVTVSDSNGVKLWDLRSKFPVGEIHSKYPVLTCCIDNKNDSRFYFSGIDPTVYSYDLRNLETPSWSEVSQTNSITSLSLSTSGEYLTSKSLDGTIKYFDARPIVKGKRSKPYIFDGSKSTAEDLLIRARLIESKTDETKKMVVSGSNDGFIYTWDFLSRRLLNRFDGHTGTVIDLDYSESLKKLATCSNDATVIIRDL